MRLWRKALNTLNRFPTRFLKDIVRAAGRKRNEFVTPDDPCRGKMRRDYSLEFTEGNEDLLQEIIDCQK